METTPEVTVNPGNSANQTGSVSLSSVGIRRLEIYARTAAVEAPTALDAERRKLELDEVLLWQKRQEFEIKAEIGALAAEEEVLTAGYRNESKPASEVCGDVVGNYEHVAESPATSVDDEVVINYPKLNPLAKEFVDPVLNVREDPTLSLLHQGQLQTAQMIDAVRLPTLQLTPFDGNLLSYWPFMGHLKTVCRIVV